MKDDFSALTMEYSGRGIVVGLTNSGKSFLGYSLTGRSSSSQARKLVQEKSGVIRTEVTNKEQLEKGSIALLLYPAIVPIYNAIIASNGAQTKLLYSSIKRYYDRLRCLELEEKDLEFIFADASKHEYEYDVKDDRWIDLGSHEPDAPHNTPRISGFIQGNKGMFHLIKYDSERKEPIHYSYRFYSKFYPLEPGKGFMITTYKGGNENPLLPFEGSPLEVRINSENAEDISKSLYEALRGQKENYRVSAAVILMNGHTGEFETSIINRCERGD